MTDWKSLQDTNPAPSLLDAIAHAEKQAMKRWMVDLQFGKVELAVNQHYKRAEYLPFGAYPEVAFVLAVDELGAFARAKQLIAEYKP